MNSPVVALRIASAVFGVMALVHVIRIIVAATVTLGGYPIGRRWSAVAIVLLAALCIWLWRVASAAAKKAEPAAPTSAA